MRGFLSSLLTDYRAEVERHRNRPFLRASMAACALAAAADGDISFGERIRVDQILETLEELKVFDPHEAVDLFDGFSSAILDDPETGRKRALSAVEEVTSSPQTACLLLRICLAIAGSGGATEHPGGRHRVASLGALLGIDPEAAGLEGLAAPGGPSGSARET